MIALECCNVETAAMRGYSEKFIICIDWYSSDSSSGTHAFRLFPTIFQLFLILSEEISIPQPRHTQLPLSTFLMQVLLLSAHIWAGILYSLSWQVVISSDYCHTLSTSIPPPSSNGIFITCLFADQLCLPAYDLLIITAFIINCTDLMLLCGYPIAYVKAVSYLIRTCRCYQM